MFYWYAFLDLGPLVLFLLALIVQAFIPADRVYIKRKD